MEVVLESLKCEVIVIWLSIFPSKCRGDLCCVLPLVSGCICLREELCTPKLYYPNPQWRFPVWEDLCRRYSENPSV